MTNAPAPAPRDAQERVRPFAAALGVLTIAVLAGLWQTKPAVSAPPPVETASTVEIAPADSAAFRIVPTEPTTAATPSDSTPTADQTPAADPTDAAPAVAILVPDPRPGDLRVDVSADVLPSSYRPAPAATVIRDVAYGTEPSQQLDLYLPAGDHAPVLLYLHTGGWVGGDKAAVPDMVMRFVERGYAVASVNYHLAPEHTFPTPVTDVKLALRWLKAYADTEGLIDGNRIVLVGASSGGHLAAFAAATPGKYEPTALPAELAAYDSTVVGVVSFVGPTDLVQLYDQPHDWARGITSAFTGCFPCTTAQLTEPSIAGHLHADLPPAYWAYGTEDPLIDPDAQAVATAEAWATAAGLGTSWLDLADGAGHTLDQSMINQRALEAFVDGAVGSR